MRSLSASTGFRPLAEVLGNTPSPWLATLLLTGWLCFRPLRYVLALWIPVVAATVGSVALLTFLLTLFLLRRWPLSRSAAVRQATLAALMVALLVLLSQGADIVFSAWRL